MKKILLSMLAVLSILFFITACGEKAGGNNPPEIPSTKTLKERINEAKDGDIIDLGKEEIEIKHGDSYTIDKSITIKNGDAKYATFIVESTGATLLNLRNIESVIADEQLDDGDLAIRNCFEVDSVYVNGGGSNSIHIASTSIKNLYVAKEDVRVVLKNEVTGKTAKVENVQINSNCKLESEDADASFGKVQISADVETVTLAGKAKVEKILAETAITEDAEEAKATVAIESSDVKIEKTSANVELTVSEKVEEEIQLPETEVINTTYTVTTVVAGKNSSYKVYEGYQFTSEPIEYGYKFIGWYVGVVKKSDGTLDWTNAKAVTIPYAVKKDVTLYAKFEKIQYESSFFVVGEGFVSSEVGKKYYTDLELGTIKGATIKTESGYDVITIPSATSTSDVWSYWADSLENWNFKADKNYKISVEIKADAKTLVVLQAKPINSNNANQKKVEVGTEWQTVEIETGCWNKDFLGYLQVACGRSNKTYLRNLKMEEVSTKSIPAGTWGSDADSISVTQVENGVKFTFEKESAAWTNGAAIRGNFVETSKNYLYKVSFTAVSDAEDVSFEYSIDAWAEDNAWGKATIGTTAKDFELYMPAYQLDGDKIRGAEINISIATKNSVTITDVSFEPLTTIPSDQVIFFTSDYVNYQRITGTGKDNCIVLEVAADSESELRFVMEKASNSKIEWNNSSSFGKFENKSSATVAIPEDKDYPVLKNTSKTSQSYRLYIDETWKIVIEDFVPVKYTVNFVTTEESSGVVVESQNVESGTEIELQQLADIEGTETFKEFAGWYEGVVKKSDGTLDWTNAKAVTSPYAVTKDVTLYAKFEKKPYESSFFVVGEGFVSSEVGKKYYTDLELGTIKGATIKTESGYDVITIPSATSTSDVWSYWADSLENWNFKANKNYKISVEIKADAKTLVVLQAKAKNTHNANQKNVEVGTEWQTVEIETGCWNKDFLGYLQVACGRSNKTYLRNLKMEEVSTKSVPAGTWGPDADSISVTQVENGVKFTFEKESAVWTNGATIIGNFVETSKNYLYKVKFTAVADANVEFNYSIDSWAGDNAWGKATLGTTPSNFELYMPAYQLDGDEIRGAEINISIATKNSVTITDVSFEPLTKIPSDQVIFFTSDYVNYQRITSTGKDNCIVLEVAGQKEAPIRFVMEKASNSKIEWDNSCSFVKFENKSSATVAIPEDKDYPVLKNTSNTSQTYKLYIDETWTIVIEDKIEEATINFVTCYDHSGIVVAPITAPIGNQVTLSEIENQSGANFYAIFEGWYENVVITQEGTLDFSSAILVTSPYTVTKDVTLYAKWKYSEPNPPADPDFPNDISFAAPNGVTISKTDSEFVIENANSSQDENIWSIGVSSEQNFEMKEGQNYKVSVEVKADSEKEVLFRLNDILHSESYAQKKVTVNTEWQTVVFETGSWQADWESIFQVFMGMVDKIYLRNLKIETLDTKVLPVAASEKSILSNITENGFTVQIDDTSEWISIEGQKVEFGNLYLVSFDVAAEEETNIKFAAKASSGKYADAWYKTTIGTASTKVELYVPHVGSESDFDFIDMGYNSSVATTLTVSNFEVATVPMDEKPDVLFALKGLVLNSWNLFPGYLGSGQNITIPAGESFEVFAQIGVENFDNWDVVSELRYVEGAEILDISTNKDGRPVITNNTEIDRDFMLWIYDDYRIIIEETQTYSVTFNLNGGSFNGSSSSITLDVSNLLAVKPEKEGYTFVGWTLEENGTEFISNPDSDCTVYAQWKDNLLLFVGSELCGDFSVVEKGETYVYDDTLGIELNHEGNGIYTATFTYQDYMTGWNSLYGTCQFKLRTSKGNWGGTSYGIADSANQPIIGGDAVLIDSVQGNNIVVTGFVVNTTYKITVTCSQEGTVTLKVDQVL